jgi:hypothetical protein
MMIVMMMMMMMIIRDNGKGTCMLIDIVSTGDRTVIKKKPRKF